MGIARGFSVPPVSITPLPHSRRRFKSVHLRQARAPCVAARGQMAADAAPVNNHDALVHIGGSPDRRAGGGVWAFPARHGNVAQMARERVDMPENAGSSPAIPTKAHKGQYIIGG